MRRRTRIAGIATGIVLAASALTGGTALADTGGTAGSCFSDNPDRYNGITWEAHTEDEVAGKATFAEYGEHLTVTDLKSDGMRTYAYVRICYDGEWIDYEFGDHHSGPDEGDIDTETYNLSFKDGRFAEFWVCNVNEDSMMENCGPARTVVA